MAKVDSGLSLQINLLSKRRSLFQTIIAWIGTYGLVLTALISLVVIGLSSYRFSLQKQLASLKDQIQTNAQEITKQTEFENQFLLTQKKLDLYQEISQTEHMEDLFPKLNSLVPEGVQVRSLTISQNSVELVCFVSNQLALTHFVDNLKLANNVVFDDGQTLTIANVNAKEIAKSSDGGSTDNSYDFSLGFNYTLN